MAGSSVNRPGGAASLRREGRPAGDPAGPGPERWRTFLAVFPPDPALDAIEALRSRLEPGLDGLRWTGRANLHFTLRFFGDLVPAEAARAGEVLAAVAAGVVPFDLELAGLGVFPGWTRPRVLWVGCGAGGAVLEALARTLDRGFCDAGLGGADKPFRAHLTLARWRDPRGADGKAARAAVEGADAPARFSVTEASVVRSVLGPGGSTYLPLRTEALRGAPPR